MKKFINYILFLITITGISNALGQGQNNLTFTPSSQSITTTSGTSTNAYIDVICSGNGLGACHFGINFDGTSANGYVGHTPANGALNPGQSVEIEFTFNLTVTSTTTVNYPFHALWFDETGQPHDSYFDIEVTYEVSNCTLSPPSNKVTSNVTTNSAQISWNPRSGAIGYHSQYKASSSPTWITVNNGSPSTSQTISGLSPDTSYQWRVRSKCSNGTFGNWSNNVNFTTDDENSCYLPFPSNIIIDESTYQSVRIRWDNVSGNNGYVIRYRKFSGGGPVIQLILPQNTTLRIVNNLDEDTAYWFNVATICPDGSWSEWSSDHYKVTLENCPENIDRYGYHSVVGTHQVYIAEKNIYSNHWDVIAGTHIEYNAGESVILENGFRAESGSVFSAYIEGCTPPTPDSKNSSKTDKETGFKAPNSEVIMLYPNPTKGQIVISSEQDMLSWKITNQFGNVRKRQTFESQQKEAEMDITQFPTGVYFVTITLANGKVINKTLIKE